jgi:hypothetical protein
MLGIIIQAGWSGSGSAAASWVACNRTRVVIEASQSTVVVVVVVLVVGVQYAAEI